ncbi:hypothetical protein NKH84_24020 [Mesorhizobium sp. M0902]|uniref:hypothetical protein n=1 Tax=unclassified Mesorhizobium TaxID=325217 RepID=UPI003339AEE7
MLGKLLSLLQAAAIGGSILLGTIAAAKAASPTVWETTAMARTAPTENAIG